MPSHTSLPAPSAGSGPQPPSTPDVSGATDTSPNGMDEPRANADPAQKSGEPLADRAAEEVFGSMTSPKMGGTNHES